MEKTIKKYVEYLYPGIIASETSSVEIDHNDPMKVEIENDSVGFRFYEQDVVLDGKEEFIGNVKNKSNWFFLGTRITFEEVQKRFGHDPAYKTLIRNMKYNDISSVCMTEYGNFMPMANDDVTLDEYIAKHSKEKNAMKMFENLKKHVGEKISYKYWHYGVEQNDVSTLKSVDYFGNIGTENKGIPFIGYGAAISSITLDETGEMLYVNPYIEDNYDRRKPEDIEASKRKFYGDVIVDKQRARRIKAEQKRKQEMENADREAQKLKYTLMKEGVTLVKPETIEDWLQFADINSNDGYSVFVVKATISMMKKFEEGVSFEDAEQQVYCDELGLSGFMASGTANALSYFAKEGEKYQQYWNKKWGIENSDEKGTVNPVILSKQ